MNIKISKRFTFRKFKANNKIDWISFNLGTKSPKNDYEQLNKFHIFANM